jgi:hypothetical protein
MLLTLGSQFQLRVGYLISSLIYSCRDFTEFLPTNSSVSLAIPIYRTIQCPGKMASSGMLRRVALVRTSVSEELNASIIRFTDSCYHADGGAKYL